MPRLPGDLAPVFLGFTHTLGFPSDRRKAMRKLGQFALNFLKNEDGPTAVEYAVMLALIIVVCITAISALGSNASNTFQYVGNKVSTTSS
jgi:pilus assembly protein Flp/PilA